MASPFPRSRLARSHSVAKRAGTHCVSSPTRSKMLATCRCVMNSGALTTLPAPVSCDECTIDESAAEAAVVEAVAAAPLEGVGESTDLANWR
jgi:hypothetical protein